MERRWEIGGIWKSRGREADVSLHCIREEYRNICKIGTIAL